MIKAYGYIRVSGDGQLDGDGPERQSLGISEYAGRNDITIVKEYIESYTGKDLDRPVLQELIAEILANGVRTIVIEKLDRLARDVVVQELLIRDFQKNGITLISTMEVDLCSKDPSRVMFRQMLGVISGYERAMIVFRTKSARDRIRAKGERCEGRKPFGGHPGKPEEREILATMCNLRRDGFDYARISEYLNEHGLFTREGNAWRAFTVRRTLLRASKYSVKS